MEKDRLKVYKPSSGDASLFYRETSASDQFIRFDTSAAIGNLADVMARGPVVFPNILAPDCFRTYPLSKPVELAPSEPEDKR